MKYTLKAGIGVMLITVSGVLGAQAQDLTHPRQMGLPDSDFVRPDPADYRLVLENGLNVYLAEDRQAPLVTLGAYIRVGKVNGKQGAAEVLADALQNSGPTAMTPETYRSALKTMTAELSVTMHEEWTEVTLNVPTEDAGAALDLFAALLRSPAIEAANIAAAFAGARPGEADVGAEAGPVMYEGSLNATVSRFREIVFADHVYVTPPVAADFDELNVADVKSFHEQYFVPGNIVVTVAGDVDTDEVNQLLAAEFSDWQAAPVPPVADIPAAAAANSEQHTFPANKLQSWLVFGHALPPVPLEEQAALEVMNHILAGGHLWTRMTIETRYRYGYTNDASGFLEENWYGPGTYDFRSYSRPEVIKSIYRNMMDEIARIQTEAVSDDELFVAKGALTDGSFQVLYLNGYETVRNFALERLRFGDHSRSATYIDRIRDVTREDVLAAAKKYLRPDEMQVVLVGKPEALLD